MIKVKYDTTTGDVLISSTIVGNTHTPEGCALLCPLLFMPVGTIYIPQSLHNALTPCTNDEFELYHPTIPEWSAFHPPAKRETLESRMGHEKAVEAKRSTK